MNEILQRLEEILHRLDDVGEFDLEAIIDTKNKLNLYVQKFFNSKEEYIDILKSINTRPNDKWEFRNVVTELKSLTSTLIQDIEISTDTISVLTEEEKNKILAQARKEAEIEKERIENEAREIRNIKEELLKERESLLLQEQKFREFQSKLEIADKRIDFQFQAARNKVSANIWAVIGGILISFLIIVLFRSLGSHDSFSEIAESVKSKMNKTDKLDVLTLNTIYFSYSKYIFTKLLLYSLLIYAIIFCVKNYNAQMHNNIINSHRSNALKSTLSLLDTAKSDDGNDKLLIQATQAIFAHQQSGYSGKESEPPSPNLVTNVIDTVSKKI